MRFHLTTFIFIIFNVLGLYAQVPTITSFSPASGPIGTTVTIAGTNFSTTPANNIVYFGAVRSNVTSATITQLVVTVPAGATYQPITVTKSGLTAYSKKIFNVTFTSSRTIYNGSFASYINLAPSTTPIAIEIADFDLDGKPDLATTNYGDNTISIFKNLTALGNLTTSSFSTKTDFVTGSGPKGISAADLDGDGKLDLIVTNNLTGANSISILRNIASAGIINSSSFAGKVDFTTGNHPANVVVGDLNGDAKPEIVVINETSYTLSIFRNTSAIGSITTSSFASPNSFNTGDYPVDVKLEDIDGDGKKDILVANLFNNSISIFRNVSAMGSISFATRVDFSTPAAPQSIATGDLDNDGKPDIVIGNQGTKISIYKNTSVSGIIDASSLSIRIDINVGSQTNTIKLADIDGDSKPDICGIKDNVIYVIQNDCTTGSINSSSFLSDVNFNSYYYSNDLAIADINLDGMPDMLATSSNLNDYISILKNTNSLNAPNLNSTTAINSNSFTINWNSTVGAAGYYLDVSINNFSTFVTGYNNKSVGNVTLSNVASLSPGTSYQYRVRASNTSGTSTNSSNISVTTLSTEPAAYPSLFMASPISNKQIDLSFSSTSTISNGLGYIILRRQDGTNPTVSGITDGVAPGTLSLPSGTTFVTNIASTVASTFNNIGLTVNTQYNYLIIPYNYNGVDAATYNYKIDGTIKTAVATPVYSNSSNIVTDGSFVSANLAYATYQEATNLTASNSLEVAKFILQDGGGSSDADDGNTTLNAISFSITNASIIRRVALYDGIDWLAETTPSGSTVSFTGLNIVAPDNGSKTFSVRVSFNATVTDNQQFSFAVTSATAALSGSGFASSNASGAATSTAGDNNRLEVTATKITYTTQPPSLIGVNTNVSPVPVLEARDVLNNKDLDYSSTITLSNSASLTMANGPTAFSSGALTFPTNFQFTSYGTSTLTVASGTLTSATSGTIVVRAAEPVAQPIGLTFNTVTATTMNGSFTAATGSPDGYLVVGKEASAPTGLPVDGTVYSPGNDIGDGKGVASGSIVIFSNALLTAGTVYHYAVYSYNGSGQAINYLTTSPMLGNEITRPPPPTVEEAANVIPGSFKTKWSAAKSATSYQLFVAKDQGFASPLANYNPKTVSILEEQLIGLETSQTSYWYKVKAVNSSGASDDSNVVTVITPGAGGVSLLSFSSSSNNGVKVSATLAGGTGARIVTLHYRKIVSASFSDETLAAAGDTFEKDITTDLMDELGIEYYFTAIDASISNPIETAHGFIYKTFNETGSTIPFSSRLDGTTTTYEMFSVPYKLDKSDVPSVFKQEYDKTKWRLFHFQNEKTIENLNGFNSIELGKGYWFNAKGKFDVSPGAGKVAEANQSKDFIVTLAAGWNQIGNPYPFNVDWNQIKDANPAAGLNALHLYENGYVKKDVLAPWKGAFVFSDNGGAVSFPVLAKTASPGRRQENELKPVLDEAAWQLPVTLRAGDITQVSGVGMHPEAKTSKDRFDEITIPRFIDYLEMNTYHNEFFAPYFATDIVPTSDSYSWQFTLSSNLGSRSASLSWDQQSLNLSQSKIALLDLHNGVLIDMKSRASYEFDWQEGMQFKILYSRTGDLLPGVTALGQSYPNPFTKNVVIPVLLESNQQEAEISVYDLLGRKVKSIGLQNVKAGIHEVEWDGNNEQGVSVEGGMYFYQLRGTKGAMSPAKRMIKQ